MKKTVSRVYMGFIFLFLYAPILVMIFFSFNSTKSKSSFDGFSLHWYRALFNDAQMMEALLNTLLVAVCASVLATLLGTVAALGIFNMKKRAKAVAINISNIPVINPEIVTGISLMVLFVTVLGITGGELGFFTTLLAHVVFNTPYIVLNVLARLRRMNPNMYEAALDLGCSPRSAFRKVVIPEIMPGIMAGFLMAFTFSLDDFVISYFTSGNFQTLPIYINGLLKKPIPLSINALSALLFLIVLTALILANVWNKRQEKAEARK